MKSPTPIDQLPSFIAKSNGIPPPGSNPWWKYIFVGGILCVAIVISASAMRKAQQNTIKFKPNENDHEKQ
jgi:hypothetical protein